MKKLLPKKYRRLIWAGLLVCLILYVLGSLLVPPLAGTQRKSDRQIKLPVPAAERVCLVDGNEEALLWRLRLIHSAQSEIVLSTFDFRVDESGSDVVAALLDAAERGVQVRLLVDGMNAQLHLQGSAAFQALAAHENAAVRFYNPLRLTRLWTANYRCHDKYLIIDRGAYLMGGRNTSDLFLGSGGTTRQNMDRDVVVHGGGSGRGSAAALLDYFEDIWALDTNRSFWVNGEKGTVQRAAAALGERWAAITGAGRVTPIDWDAETIQANGVTVLHGDCAARNKEPMLLNTLTALMQGGRERIVVQTPYIICNRAMYDALQKAATGAAQVQIITNAPQSGANPWGCADYLNQKKTILSTGVSVCEWHGERSMHTKTILIDGRFSIIGSFNWDMRSAYLDTELMLLVDCPELNATLRAEADEMVRQGKLLLPDGAAVEGAAYTAPEMPPYKKLLQPVLRVVIRPFRYVL